MNIPQQYLCPIGNMIMREPILLSDGNSYEKEIFNDWLSKYERSPLTGQRLSLFDKKPNDQLKIQIQNYLNQNLELFYFNDIIKMTQSDIQLIIQNIQENNTLNLQNLLKNDIRLLWSDLIQGKTCFELISKPTSQKVCRVFVESMRQQIEQLKKFYQFNYNQKRELQNVELLQNEINAQNQQINIYKVQLQQLQQENDNKQQDLNIKIQQIKQLECYISQMKSQHEYDNKQQQKIDEQPNSIMQDFQSLQEENLLLQNWIKHFELKIEELQNQIKSIKQNEKRNQIIYKQSNEEMIYIRLIQNKIDKINIDLKNYEICKQKSKPVQNQTSIQLQRILILNDKNKVVSIDHEDDKFVNSLDSNQKNDYYIRIRKIQQLSPKSQQILLNKWKLNDEQISNQNTSFEEIKNNLEQQISDQIIEQQLNYSDTQIK